MLGGEQKERGREREHRETPNPWFKDNIRLLLRGRF